MADIKVSGRQLEALRDALKQSNNEIAGVLRDLDGKVTSLRSAWSGEASDAYDKAQRQWDGHVAELNRILAEYAGRLNEVDAVYREATSTIADKIWR